MPLLFF